MADEYVTAVLADGRQLQFPKGTDPSVIQASVKKVMAGGKPEVPPAGPKLGPVASSAVRPIAEGLGGIATMIPDAMTTIGNALPASKFLDTDLLTGKPLDPGRIQSPGNYLQSLIDRFTTAPSTKTGKLEEFINSVLVGGVAGPRMPKVPSAGPVAKRLASEGVVTTPGQRAAEGSGQISKLGAFLEEKAGSLHPSIANARGRATEQWNRARLNQVLKSVGGKELPAQITNLRDANRHVYRELQRRYGEALSKTTISLGGKTPFEAALQKARELYHRNTAGADSPLGKPEIAQLRHMINSEIVGKFTTAGKASGDTIKNIENLLRTEAEKLEGSEDYAKRQLAKTLTEIRNAFKQTVTQQNPKAGADLERLDSAYADYKLSEKASLAATTKSGAYTPGQRLAASKARDTSKDKGDFARGESHGEREAEEAQKLLGNKEPNSGTPAGMALLSALSAGSAGVAGAHPGIGLPGLLGVLGPMGLYSQPVLKRLQQMALADQESLSKLGIVGAGQQAPNPIAEGQ